MIRVLISFNSILHQKACFFVTIESSTKHILPKIDELRILITYDKCPDIYGLCEAFLDPDIMNQQIQIEGYDFKRKDRKCTLDKTGGGPFSIFVII